MTDLERAWDEMPVGPARTDAVLREGRRAEMSGDAAVSVATATVRNAERRRRFLIRPLLTAGVATAVVGAFVAGSLLDSDGGAGGDGGLGSPQQDPSYVAFSADLQPAASCEELRDDYIDRGLDLVTAWGWGSPYPYYWDGPVPLAGMVRDQSMELDAASANRSSKAAYDAGTTRATSSETGTNVQEAGVDEPDTVKTDGEILVRVKGSTLQTFDVSGKQVRPLGGLELDDIDDPELLLTGDTLVAVGADGEAPRRSASTRVTTLSLADPATPEVLDEVTYDAAATSVRQHGDAIRLVLASGLPDLDFTEPGKGTTRREALEANRTAVEESAIGDWLPSVTTAGPGEAEQAVECTDVALAPDEVGLGTTTVVGFAADAPGETHTLAVAGNTDIAYESVDHLYLAATSGGGERFWPAARTACVTCTSKARPGTGVEGGTSYLFDFELDGTRARHVASGEVEGDIRDRWAIDETDGVLRVAVGPTQDTGSFNSVVTLERQGQDLVELGRLDRLGPNEDIQSVRWFEDLAIVVTFRQVDPLYAIDLSDDADPTLIGKLKIPGFSSYLHPLGSKRLIGVGEGPVETENGRRSWGARMGLFDVTDLTDPRQIDVHGYAPGSRPVAGEDPRAFTWLPAERTVLTVIERWGRTRTGSLSITTIADGELETTTEVVEYGDDVDLVRTVPVGEGKVVLLTGEDARFLDLG